MKMIMDIYVYDVYVFYRKKMMHMKQIPCFILCMLYFFLYFIFSKILPKAVHILQATSQYIEISKNKKYEIQNRKKLCCNYPLINNLQFASVLLQPSDLQLKTLPHLSTFQGQSWLPTNKSLRGNDCILKSADSALRTLVNDVVSIQRNSAFLSYCQIMSYLAHPLGFSNSSL